MTSGPLLVDAGSVVCSGAAMDFNATNHTMSFNAYWNVPPVPSKSTGSSYNIRLAGAQFTGVENPEHTITGVYDDTGRSYDNFTSLTTDGAYRMTGSMLKGVLMAGSVFALIDSEVIKAATFGSGSMVYVVPQSYNVIRTPSSASSKTNRGYVIDYSIKLKEVQV